jgi:hypothetical protein
MLLKAFIDALDHLGALIGTASKASGNEVRALKNLFDPGEGRPISEALDDLRQVLQSQRTAVQAKYIERLRGAGTDETAFNTVMRELEKEKHLDKEMASAIAHGYTDGRKEWPTAKAAFKAIRKTFDQRAYQESKLRLIG